MSEPEAGSDATSQQTTAIEKEDYIINGTKNWITNGGIADVYLVVAQTDRNKGHKGINVFIVEKNTPGFSKALKKINLVLEEVIPIPCNLMMSKVQKKPNW